MNIIEAKGISKTIINDKKEYNILTSNWLNIEVGEFVAIMGPSGSGKSSLLNILGGLDISYEGELYCCGEAMNKMKVNQLLTFRRKKIGMIFQNLNLIESLTVQENLQLPTLFARCKENEERTKKLLMLVNMFDKRNEKCSYLSGGEKQRIAIARAFMLHPKILLADEPTGALDSRNGINIMELLSYVNKELNTTIVLVTHDMQMASYAKRIIYIKDGHIQK